MYLKQFKILLIVFGAVQIFVAIVNSLANGSLIAQTMIDADTTALTVYPIIFLFLGIGILIFALLLPSTLGNVSVAKGVCSKCGKENAPDQKFCGGCGGPL